MLQPTHKIVPIRTPQAIVDDDSWVTTVVDTLGARRCTVYAMLGATDIAMVALKLQESDAISDPTTLAAGADIPGTVFGASGAPALPTADDDNKVFAFDLDLRGSRKRYVKLIATAGDGSAGTFLTAWAELSLQEELPSVPADRGLAAEVLV